MKSFVLAGAVSMCLGCGGVTASTADSGPGDGGLDDATVHNDASDGAANDAGATACSGPGTCALRPIHCCGTCQKPTLADFVAVPVSDLASYDQTHCYPVPPCPPCVDPPDPTGGGRFQPVCRTHRCEVVDIATEPVAACASDGDCVLRGSDCCECGSKGWVAIGKTQGQAYANLVCPPFTACPECLPSPPATLRASCDSATHHCVAITVDAGP